MHTHPDRLAEVGVRYATTKGRPTAYQLSDSLQNDEVAADSFLATSAKQAAQSGADTLVISSKRLYAMHPHQDGVTARADRR